MRYSLCSLLSGSDPRSGQAASVRPTRPPGGAPPTLPPSSKKTHSTSPSDSKCRLKNPNSFLFPPKDQPCPAPHHKPTLTLSLSLPSSPPPPHLSLHRQLRPKFPLPSLSLLLWWPRTSEPAPLSPEPPNLPPAAPVLDSDSGLTVTADRAGAPCHRDSGSDGLPEPPPPSDK